MFSDPHMAMMFMQVLCFAGTLVMFLFIVRSLAAQTAAVRDAQRRQQEALADVERQMMDMAFHLRRMSAGVRVEAGGPERTEDLGGLLETVSQESSVRIQEDLAGKAYPEGIPDMDIALPETRSRDAGLAAGREPLADRHPQSPREQVPPDLDLSVAGRATPSDTGSRSTPRHDELYLRLDG